MIVRADMAALADDVARRFAGDARAAIAARARFAVALLGGSTARAVLPRIAAADVDWSRTQLFWIDERAVAPDHADSNYRVAREALIDRIAIPAANVHRMPADAADPDAAAREHERALAGPLDLVLLGMGPDGHVCSLFPGHPALDERARRVIAIDDSPKPPPRRMTLTLVALAEARAICFVVGGADKAPAVKAAVCDADSQLPAARVVRSGAPVTWMLDRAAAGSLPEEALR